MVVQLVVASLNYSSWSVRAWLVLCEAGVDFETLTLSLFDDDGSRETILRHSPTGKVPCLRDGSLSLSESLAICEYVNERYAGGKLWPDALELRARARALSCEMAAGFPNLRRKLPMNHRARAKGFVPDEQTQWEIRRAQDAWREAREASGGPYLYGDFCIADAMFLPLLSRFDTYGVTLDAELVAYREAMFERESVRRWNEVAQEAPAIHAYDALLQRA
jgi:glutathione S-transferase